MFKTTLKLNNKIYEAEGETLLEAFNELVKPLAYPKTKMLRTSGLVTVYGKKKTEVNLRIMPLKRFINNKVSREIWANRLQ